MDCPAQTVDPCTLCATIHALSAQFVDPRFAQHRVRLPKVNRAGPAGSADRTSALPLLAPIALVPKLAMKSGAR